MYPEAVYGILHGEAGLAEICGLGIVTQQTSCLKIVETPQDKWTNTQTRKRRIWTLKSGETGANARGEGWFYDKLPIGLPLICAARCIATGGFFAVS